MALLLQAGDMGSARMGLGATVHRFKKVSFAQLVPCTTSCTTYSRYDLQQIKVVKTCDFANCWKTTCALQVFEEPQKKQMLYWVAAIVAVLFILYNLIKYSRR